MALPGIMAAEEKDIQTVVSLISRYIDKDPAGGTYDMPSLLAGAKALVCSGDAEYYIAKNDNGEPCGGIAVSLIMPGFGCAGMLYVEEGAPFATAHKLVSSAHTWLHIMGVDNVSIVTTRQNEDRKFYKKLGFARAGKDGKGQQIFTTKLSTVSEKLFAFHSMRGW